MARLNKCELCSMFISNKDESGNREIRLHKECNRIIENEIKEWEEENTYDLEDVPGFENVREYLLKIRTEREKEWAINMTAKSLGVEGLYKMIIGLQEQITFQNKIINRLTYGDEKNEG